MCRVLFVFPGLGLKIHGFGLMLVLACFGALRISAWRARRERLDPETVYGLASWLFTGGIIGARAFFLIQYHETVRDWTDILRFWQGGIVFYGCILGGLAGSLIYWARHPFPFRPMADAVAPALALGVALGRVGCFLNGCCHGAVCDLPWALRFPAETLPWVSHVRAGLIPPTATHSLPIHPTQLYAALDGFLLLGLLFWYFPRRRRDGEVMALLMVTYPVALFLEESLRADEAPFFGGIRPSRRTSAQGFSSAA